ncbi:MAG: cation:proton antiporter [Candidatus Nanohaloarchaea archaeon]|nr:cation:proton antiporter [Candidatus Nanohaloarchaea archaeon]
MHNLAAVFIAAGVLLYIGKKLDQPSIPLYIVAGIFLGPNVLGLLQNSADIITMAELGIIFLLFTAGLETDIEELRSLGKAIFTAGASHTVIVGIVAFLLAYGLGFNSTAAIYIALFVSFSSTMEVLNILEKKFELNTLHGKLIVSILLIEDILAIIAISSLANLGGGLQPLFSAIISALGIFSIAIVASRYVTLTIFNNLEPSVEQTIFAALTTVFLFLGLSSVSNLPLAVGAFTGGISLTKFPYGIEVKNSVKSLRDFFGTVFFVSIGALVNFPLIGDVLAAFLLFTGLVILVKPFLTYLMMSFYGYGQRTSFLTGLGLGQVSEFSLFILLEGFMVGAISETVFALCLGIAITTITISSYSYKNHRRMYELFSDSLIDIRKIITPTEMQEYSNIPDDISDHILLVGCHVQGQEVLEHLQEHGHEVLVVDYNVEIVSRLGEAGTATYYGDIKSIDFEDLHIDDARMIVSTVPMQNANIRCIEAAKDWDLPVIVRAEDIDDALELYNLGADYVIFPEFLAAERTSEYIIDYINDSEGLQQAREDELAYLESREEDLVLLEYGPTFLKHFRKDIAEEDS